MIPEQIRQQIKTVKFYTHSNPLVNNLFTTCLFIMPNNQILARGVSICSPQDQHSAKHGKNQAFGRALKAAISEQSTLPIVHHTSSKTIQKTFKFKSPQQRSDFWDNVYRKIIDNPKPCRFINAHNNQYLLKITVPVKYAVNLAKFYFNYKSEYMPQILPHESTILTDENDKHPRKHQIY